MKFVILVTAPPYSHQGSLTAYHFCKAALNLGQEISQVFFYADGVNNASNCSIMSADKPDVISLWQTLTTEYSIELAVCVTAAERRGISENKATNQQGKNRGNLAENFKISGLGQFLIALHKADKMIQFG